MNKQEILNAYNFRHACKEFDSTRKIPNEDFEFILETARLSPSSFGFEPWHFLIVQDPAVREKFLPMTWGAQRQFPTASHVIFTLVKKPFFMRYDSEYIQTFMRNIQELPEDIVELKGGFFKTFQESDFNLLESDRALTDWAAHQTYIPLANMMTAAAMIGIDSCPIEGLHRAQFDAMLASELDIDTDKYTIGYAVTFGYRKEDPRSKTRQDISKVTTWIGKE
ncbi:NAD(P)H-dependent oxidoreductase [Pseudodesulfovibrio sp. JC047]|uniref:NAD(P)H-dependent oxidoreductase n=1 Tax=Pseudodesulfovibrio sp. JC047 TaxID=2683199 RepID=UPI0013D7EBD5|nr:NAD(P)H-dependent oxidoreductase [Pseudodesulfovibrio sp. JC047]NDV18474.1 NAD(P)H-dependent oxidoreductase [Pseudodesulfovibrio sp. JC047]